MQLHEMRLRDQPFEAIKNGTKTVEIRLLDEKRRAIKVGDRIVFSCMDNENDKCEVEVVGLKSAPNFVELFKIVDPILAGWPANTSPEQVAADMGSYYTAEDQSRYGVVGIVIEKK